jgi:hypothetical protein
VFYDASVEGKRAGGGAAIAGGLLALAGNLMHPRYGDDEDFEIYRKIAVSDRYLVSDYLLIAALILVIAGFVAVARHSGDSWAGHGRLAALVGGAIAIAQVGLELFAFKHQTEVFAGARAEDLNGSFWAANAVDHVNTALFNTWTLVFLGIAPVFIAISALRTRRFVAVGQRPWVARRRDLRVRRHRESRARRSFVTRDHVPHRIARRQRVGPRGRLVPRAARHHSYDCVDDIATNANPLD